MKTRQREPETEMLPEYDFSGKKGVRGKYHHAYQQGHTVRILQEDGNVIIQYFTLEEGAVLLAPDVRKYFPDSESVNQAVYYPHVFCCICLRVNSQAGFPSRPKPTMSSADTCHFSVLEHTLRYDPEL